MGMRGFGAAGIPVLLALLLAGCWGRLSGPEGGEWAELRRNRSLWAAQEVGSYEYRVRRLCFCGGEITAPVVVRVQDSEVVERHYAESGEPVDPQYAHLWPAVEGLFELVEDALERDAHSVSVQYHRELGYPVEVWIDYEANVADEELGFNASELVPLE